MIAAILNLKGGVGKSTLTTNLAVTWNHAGKTVVVVEADPSVFTVSRWSDDRDAAGLDPILTMKKTGRVKEALTGLDEKFDIVIVDLAGKDSPEMRSALTVADVALVPSQATQADIDATIDLVEILEQSKDYNEDLAVMVVLSRTSTNPWDTEAADSRAVLAEHYDMVLKTEIRNRKSFSSSLSDGKGVIEGRDRKAAGEITDLADEITTKLTDFKEKING